MTPAQILADRLAWLCYWEDYLQRHDTNRTLGVAFTILDSRFRRDPWPVLVDR